ncbi:MULTISPECIES: DUF5624 domain-containing protein [unclassified Microbacterium]|uniref:DUF5624 domain-containing protein n=1 Tax=unclassified Microbacterium TaxID=2609290 RepID=UPI00364E65EE
MPAFQSPELTELFTTYTASADSIGAHFGADAARRHRDDPLLVVTSTDLALYEGGGRGPQIETFRLGGRGFRELAAVSHTGPALATLVRQKELDEGEDGPGSWRDDARRFAAASRRAREANSAELWGDRIAVPAFAGRARRIAAMTDYACRLGERGVEDLLDPAAAFGFAQLGTRYLDGPDPELPVPLNRVMVATFFLTGLDIAHRLLTWCAERNLDWARLMVVIAGRSGRPTAGVTFESHSVARVIHIASSGRLDRERILLAPHAPEFPPFDGDSSAAAALEPAYRTLWAGVKATSELGALMFPGYPGFREDDLSAVPLDADTVTVSGKPAVRTADDWHALTTRLRVVMEDPRQLLSGAATDLAAHALLDAGGDPSAVFIPGLDDEPYPALTA